MLAVVKVVGLVGDARRRRRGRVSAGPARRARSIMTKRLKRSMLAVALRCVAVAAAWHASPQPPAGDDAGGLLPHRQREGRALQPRPRRPRAAAVAGQSGAADRRHQSRQVFLRGRSTPRAARCCTRAASARSTANGRRPAKRRRSNRTFSESLRFPAPDEPVRIVVKKRDAQNVFRDIWTLDDRSGRQVRRARRGGADAGPLIKLHESGDPAQQARSADPRRRLHRARARQVRARRAAADRRRCSRRRRSRSASATSTSGACRRRRRSRASRGRRSTSTAGRRSARPTTRSTPSATC